MTAGSARAAAPWYIHPAEDPEAWAELTAQRCLEFAVVNVANGPGPAYDPHYYGPALAGGSATPLLGYVPLGYGARPVVEVLQAARAWREWYGVHGLFLDETPSAAQQGTWSVSVLALLRAGGSTVIATNPGTTPCRELVEAADVTCIAELAWADYQNATPTPELADIAPEKLWHLVHSAPAGADAPDSFGVVLQQAAERGAGLAWCTPGTLPDPWATLPANWRRPPYRS